MACAACVPKHVRRAACSARALGWHTWPSKGSPCRELVGFAQNVGAVHLRQLLLQLPQVRRGPADRPGRCPQVPATASEAERRTTMRMAGARGVRGTDHPNFCQLR